MSVMIWGLDLSNTPYALDSTTIDLCLLVFPWAHFCTTKAAVEIPLCHESMAQGGERGDIQVEVALPASFIQAR